MKESGSVPDDARVHDHELIDVGGGARLERFGDRVVDRPAPGALGERREASAWRSADLRFDRDRGWSGPAGHAGAWVIEDNGVRLECRPTDAGQIGVFPEHAAMLPWLLGRGATRVLHLFAYTGLVTLALASAGAAVTHVDASRPTVAWARRNAELSELEDRPIRWIVDDTVGFVAREARRGRRYDGLILDPPTYGHGVGGRAWRLETDLAPLLDACRAVLEPTGFALLTAHTTGFEADVLAAHLAAGLGRRHATIETGQLGLATADGRPLELGSFARVVSGA
jgi:23S rRNA (cytosine1962-C5)-methyltransferase